MFRRLMYSFARFMQGRNGFDRITKYLTVLYIAVILISRTVMMFSDSVALFIIFEIIIYGLLGYMFFRMFSRNLPKRRAESERFDRFLEKLGRKKKSGGYYRNPYSYQDYNSYNTYTTPRPKKEKMPKSDKQTKYVKCKSCGAILRLKRRKGSHTAKCPKCGKDVKVFSVY